ncbi:MAG: xanthine dehydrogenase accessory protein XdhC [Pseudomonadota bacterium]
MNWIDAVHSAHIDNTPFVLVTIVSVEGSSPRSAQSKMVVTASETFDSIGGGALEFDCIEHARQLLLQNHKSVEQKQFTLGKDLEQCCGGRVSVMFECYPGSDFSFALFGAGHVGRAVVRIVSELPCHVIWLDHRDGLVRAVHSELGSPTNVSVVDVENSYTTVEELPTGISVLIMTHSHELDMELCEAALSRPDINYCGLIGSESKSAKFRSRLSKKGFTQEELSRLVCPVGLPLTDLKEPMAVAISVVAELMQRQSLNT